MFTPQAGHEQAGRRPAFVLSPRAYNKTVGLFVVCPITSQVKGYPFEVQLSASGTVRGVVLADQLKSLDWKVRKAEFIETAPQSVIDEVTAKILPLLDEEV